MEKVAVIGAGSWGTGISKLLAEKGGKVILWAREKEVVQGINDEHRNPLYLTDIFLPNGVISTWDMADALKDAQVVIFAVPSQFMRRVVEEAKKHLKKKKIILSVTKGLEESTLFRMSEVIEDVLGKELCENIAVLSGPNHAEEVSEKIPSATVISAYKKEIALFLQSLFMTPYFRVYTNPDIVGVELGGATKNVMAIAAGISDGLGFGDNTKASLITRGLAEMIRLGKVLGANPLTFSGLSGMGDLVVTCVSKFSRNRYVGEEVGKGRKLKDVLSGMKMVAEGVTTSKAVLKLAERYGVEVPITRNVVEVLYEDKDPRSCVKDLMERGAAEEIPWD